MNEVGITLGDIGVQRQTPQIQGRKRRKLDKDRGKLHISLRLWLLFSYIRWELAGWFQEKIIPILPEVGCTIIQFNGDILEI